jgi:hypothetical protein
MDNVQKHNICINVPSSQTFRFHLESFIFEHGNSFVNISQNLEALCGKWGSFQEEMQ